MRGAGGARSPSAVGYLFDGPTRNEWPAVALSAPAAVAAAPPLDTASPDDVVNMASFRFSVGVPGPAFAMTGNATDPTNDVEM